jgi:hypothetical protein
MTHTSVTGRPTAGRSRTQVGRRSCSRARTPQAGQNPSASTVSTACSTSPSYSDTASSRNPGNPSITVAAVASSRTWTSLDHGVDTLIVRSQARFRAQARGRVTARSPRFTEKSQNDGVGTRTRRSPG